VGRHLAPEGLQFAFSLAIVISLEYVQIIIKIRARCLTDRCLGCGVWAACTYLGRDTVRPQEGTQM
jgi:hypothetical protein